MMMMMMLMMTTTRISGLYFVVCRRCHLSSLLSGTVCFWGSACDNGINYHYMVFRQVATDQNHSNIK
jgi:hypothetical protein